MLDGWSGIGDARLSLDALHPLSDDLRYSLQIDIPLNATGIVGIQNHGWWGIDVSPQVYQASFYVQPNGARFNWTALTHFNVSLRSDLTDDVWCESTIGPLGNTLSPHKYWYFNATLNNTVKAPNVNNTFAITMDASQARGQTFYFDLVSLFPETYKGRRNGLRKDLAERLKEMAPRYLRFPGGNNLEGYSIQTRWKWWKTIGPLKDRPGRPGDWTYYNTDGLGLLEYLEWCEDSKCFGLFKHLFSRPVSNKEAAVNIEPLLAVYAGFSLESATYDSWNASDCNEVPWEDMDDVLQEALDELEYCMGSTDTYWGAKRAEHGHPAPFDIKMIQIGNEDMFSRKYDDRAKYMLRGLQSRYPDKQYIFTAMYESPDFDYDIPAGGIWDQHLYIPMQMFIDRFDYYDHFQDDNRTRDVQVALMEYHASQVYGVGNSHPRMGAAVAEAVYHVGGERNPGVFRLSAFAPVIQNLNAYRHTPYDILFTADPADTVLSASYYQQQMFNVWHGSRTLNISERNGRIAPLYWVASVQEPQEEIYVKVVNVADHRVPLRIRLDVPFTHANGTVLKSREDDPLEFNYIGDHRVVPAAINDFEVIASEEAVAKGHHNDTFIWSVPPFSVSVLQFNLAGEGKGGGSLRTQPL